MVNINKNIKLIINYVAGPLLLLLIGYHLFHELKASPNLDVDQHAIKQRIISNGVMLPLISFLLMFVQWGLEALKWKMMLKATAFPVKWVTSLKMIFAGLSFSFVTPNRLGEFIGRIMYLPSDKRAVGTAFTVYNIIIQITVYCFFASIALYFLDASLVSHKLPRLVSNMLHGLQIISPVIFLLSVTFFVMQHRILSLLSNLSFLRKLKPTLGECMQLGFDTSFALIGLTLLKSLVFIFQYWLIFTWLGLELSFFNLHRCFIDGIWVGGHSYSLIFRNWLEMGVVLLTFLDVYVKSFRYYHRSDHYLVPQCSVAGDHRCFLGNCQAYCPN